MVHYLLIKLKDKNDTEYIMKAAEKLLSPVTEEIAGISDVRIIKNASMRSENMDLLIRFEMSSEAVLAQYLGSNCHKAFIAAAGPRTESKVTIDI